MSGGIVFGCEWGTCLQKLYSPSLVLHAELRPECLAYCIQAVCATTPTSTESSMRLRLLKRKGFPALGDNYSLDQNNLKYSEGEEGKI